MQLAQKFNAPILALVDTPGAYPGIGAGRAGPGPGHCPEFKEMVTIAVPIIVVIIGEGGSGGGFGHSIGDRVCVMENAYYSVDLA